MSLSQELQTGKAGEHLVCCDLIQKGYNAFLADQGLPYDVLVDVDSQIKRIQVKTISKEYRGYYPFSLRTGKKSGRQIKAESVDYVAFVFLDKRAIQYIPVGSITAPDGFLKRCVVFYETDKESPGNKRRYIIGRFNSL